jgi:hypothetical protein
MVSNLINIRNKNNILLLPIIVQLSDVDACGVQRVKVFWKDLHLNIIYISLVR